MLIFKAKEVFTCPLLVIITNLSLSHSISQELYIISRVLVDRCKIISPGVFLYFLKKKTLYIQGVNQKTTIGAVRLQFGKQASIHIQGLAHPNVAGGPGGALSLCSPRGGLRGQSPLEKILRP